MNRDRLRTGRSAGGPHTLIPATPEPPRRPLRALLLVTLAIGVGVLGGLVWLAQRGSLETLPDQSALVTATITATITATNPATATALPSETPTTAVLAARTGAGMAAAETPTPTPTSTTPPPVASVDGIVGVGGAARYDDSGVLLDELSQGAKVVVTARAADGGWLLVQTPDGQGGWAATDSLIVFDAGRLAAQEIVIIPITPTPTASSAASPAARQATPLPEGAASARVVVESGRLNLRAGPGPTYAIIAKAQPDAALTLLGRNADGTWLQVAAPEVQGGFVWAAAAYLSVTGDVQELPVATAVSAVPPYRDDGDAAPNQGMAPGPAARPSVTATGLTGLLAIQVEWGGDIYLYDLATGDLRLLTGGFDPSFSPDGMQVAFSRRGGDQGLYLIGVDGSNERRIFGTREPIASPKWSPDGRYIVFERGDEVDVCRISGFQCLDNNLSGVDSEDIATEMQNKLARVDVNGEHYRDIPVLNRAHAPDWNAAGIVYQSPAGLQITQDDPDARSELLYFDIKKQYELDPDWQPSGNRIVFQRREAAHWQIFGINADGGGLTGLTHPGTTFVDVQPSSVAPAWSPDGNHIVFLSNRIPDGHGAGAWGVWVMDADGGNQRRLPIDLPFVYTYVAEQMLDWGL